MVKKSTKKTLSDFIFKKCLPTQEYKWTMLNCQRSLRKYWGGGGGGSNRNGTGITPKGGGVVVEEEEEEEEEEAILVSHLLAQV